MTEKKDTIGNLSDAQKIMRKLRENKVSLHIGRLPAKTRADFVALADAEFCGDFGMVIKWLMDDIPHQDTRMILANMDSMNDRLCALETASEKKVEPPKNPENEETIITMCNGTERKVKG